MGDGNLSNNTGVILCTDSFDKESIEHLINEIKKLDIECYLDNNKNRIVIPNKCVYEFFDFIGESPVECYCHKWDSIVKESYKNRKCKNPNCDNIFNATVNHNYYCKSKCYKEHWKIKNQLEP